MTNNIHFSVILKFSIIIILVTSSLSVCEEVYDEALVELRDGNTTQVFFKHPVPYVPNDTPYAVSGHYQGEKIFLYFKDLKSITLLEKNPYSNGHKQDHGRLMVENLEGEQFIIDQASIGSSYHENVGYYIRVYKKNPITGKRDWSRVNTFDISKIIFINR